MCSNMRYQKKQIFFEEKQAVNQDENITSDEDEPIDVDTTSQKLQATREQYS